MSESIIIFLLIVGNGLLALAEIAVISARRARLQQMADEGDSRAQVALELAAAPGRFLSTVQIGITLVGILAGAFGGATLARQLAARLAEVPALAPYADALSVALVVLTITYLTLVLGELVPKRVALRYAEAVAVTVAKPMRFLARITSPLVHLLTVSTDGILKLFGMPAVEDRAVTEEEVRIMIAEGAQSGVFERMEEEMVDQVFRLSDRKVVALMTPRPEIVWLDTTDPLDVVRSKVTDSGHSRFPVADGTLDDIIGIVLAKDLLRQALDGQALEIRSLVHPALFVPETMPVLTLVDRFKETRSKIALVIDEYGGVEGLVTIDDVVEAIVGDIPEPDELVEAEALQREDGSWLIDGMFGLDEFQELFDLRELPEATADYYQTVGGLVMAMLGRVPATGDSFTLDALRIEVVDMDGFRVDKVLVQQLPAPTSDAEI